IADVLARELLGFVSLIALDRVDDAQVLPVDDLWIARGPDSHTENAVRFRQPDQNLVARKADDAEMECVIGSAHLLNVLPLRKFQDVIGHLTELSDVSAPSVIAGQAPPQALKHLAHLVRLADARPVHLLDEDAETVDGINQPEPLQLEQRFPYGALRNTELLRETLLTKPVTGLALAGKNPPLNFFSYV